MSLIRTTRFLLACLAAMLLSPGAASAAQATDFTSSEPITIPRVEESGQQAARGPAAPYPSTIEVSGLGTSLRKLTLTLNGYTHSCDTDLDLLLVGPEGQRVLFMSEAGGCSQQIQEPKTLIFDDAAQARLSCTFEDPTSGSKYQPTDCDVDETQFPEAGDNLPGPAPAPPYDSTFAAFNGTNPNGTWSLYVNDQAAGDNGRIASWTLSIDAPLPPKACADGDDNDGDGKTDFPADAGCASADDDDERGPAAPPATRPGSPAPTQPANPSTPSTPFADCPTATANLIRGTIASESINGTPRADRIFAGTGNDTVDGLAADDCIDLGPGTDRGQGGDGADLMVGGLGADRMSGNLGNDRLRGGAAADRLVGGFGDDTLHGQSGSDLIKAERGRDRINGGSSNDAISAGSSGDRVAGDQGNDRINGNSGNDSLSGNSGRDRITGSTGADRISGGSGNDRIGARDGKRDRVNCGSGRDSVSADRRDRVARNCERVRRR